MIPILRLTTKINNNSKRHFHNIRKFMESHRTNNAELKILDISLIKLFNKTRIIHWQDQASALKIQTCKVSQ